MLTRDGSEMGGPVSGVLADDGPVIETALEPVSASVTHRAADSRSPFRASVGAAPDRVPPAPKPVHGWAGPGPVPDAAAAASGPGHRPPGPSAQTGPLRKSPARGAGAHRHQEIGPDPRRWRLAETRSHGGEPEQQEAEPRLRVPTPRRKTTTPGLRFLRSTPTSGKRRSSRSGSTLVRPSPTPASPSKP